ncbi:Lethal(2)neighbour of tid protein, partial [Perkinsela sp. CCAP 1560/4]
MHRDAYILLLLDLLVSLWIIQNYAFTNIDWQAYVEQVRMVFADGVLDYAHIRGDSGPIAYPAGFLYIFRLITLLTKGGDIRMAQYIFAGIQCATNFILFAIYEDVMPHLTRANGVPKGWWATAFRSLVYLSLVTSRRIHSIYLLRMFNDAVSMGLFYASTLALVRHRWFNLHKSN